MNQVFVSRNNVRVYTKFFKSADEATECFLRLNAVDQLTYTVGLTLVKEVIK
jgi:hypothetical protein